MANSSDHHTPPPPSSSVPPWPTIEPLFSIVAPPTPTYPLDGVSSTDITIDAARSLWFRLYTPLSTTTTTTRLPVILFIHGGGFVFFSPGTKPYDSLCRRLAISLPAVVVSLNYRLAPLHRFPVPILDCFETLTFLDRGDSIAGAGADLTRCFIVGDSAGANLGHHVAVMAAEKAKEKNFDVLSVLGFVAIQPCFGGMERTESEMRFGGEGSSLPVERTDWSWGMYLPQGEDRDHGAANVVGPRGRDVRGLRFPRTIVVVGGSDPLMDRGKEYCEWLVRSGKEVELVVYEDMPHVFYACDDVPETGLLIDKIKGFVQELCSR